MKTMLGEQLFSRIKQTIACRWVYVQSTGLLFDSNESLKRLFEYYLHTLPYANVLSGF